MILEVKKWQISIIYFSDEMTGRDFMMWKYVLDHGFPGFLFWKSDLTIFVRQKPTHGTGSYS